MIKQENGKWVLYTADGSKQLGEFDTEAEAQAREQQINLFKQSAEALLREVGSRHTRREFEIITQVIALMRELYGEVDSLDDLLSQAEATEAAQPLTEAANAADYLESIIHASFTTAADYLFQRGIINRDERIALSGMIGDALGVFSAAMDAACPDLRARSAELIFASGRPVAEAPRSLTELVERAVSVPALSTGGDLSGIVLVEGRSANGNVYTREALESGVKVFAGKPIYADHPGRSESVDRPERSVRDLVGRLPVDPGDLWVAEVTGGPHAGKLALQYRNGLLSETAGWLATLIREGIAGDQSINAFGVGRDDPEGGFIVEAFEQAISLDFVTTAAAGGRAQLEAAAPGTGQDHAEAQKPDALVTLTVERLAEARPDIVDSIAARERRKAYGEKETLINLQEANTKMGEKLKAAQEAARKAIRDKRKLQAEQAVVEGLAGLPDKVRPQVRRLVESQVKQFVEQMEVPEISLPAEVQALPDEAQAAWLKAYMEGIATGAGEDAAAAAAWVEIYSKWEQDESGAWKQKANQEPAPVIASPETGEPMTIEALKAAIAETVTAIRQALAEGAGPGVSGGPAPNPAVNEEAETARRIEAYKRAGLTEAEAKIAVRGRS